MQKKKILPSIFCLDNVSRKNLPNIELSSTRVARRYNSNNKEGQKKHRTFLTKLEKIHVAGY